jgi:hypothetical protein
VRNAQFQSRVHLALNRNLLILFHNRKVLFYEEFLIKGIAVIECNNNLIPILEVKKSASEESFMRDCFQFLHALNTFLIKLLLQNVVM